VARGRAGNREDDVVAAGRGVGARAWLAGFACAADGAGAGLVVRCARRSARGDAEPVSVAPVSAAACPSRGAVAGGTAGAAAGRASDRDRVADAPPTPCEREPRAPRG